MIAAVKRFESRSPLDPAAILFMHLYDLNEAEATSLAKFYWVLQGGGTLSAEDNKLFGALDAKVQATIEFEEAWGEEDI